MINDNNKKVFYKRTFSENAMNEYVKSFEIDKSQLCLDNCNVNDSYNHFLRYFIGQLNHYFPLKAVKKKSKIKTVILDWVTTGIKVSSKRKRELHWQAKTSTDPIFLNYVKSYKKIFRKVVNSSKKRSNSKYINNALNKPKAMWRVVNNELGIRKEDSCGNHISLKVSNNELIEDQNVVAKTFNSFFLMLLIA